MRRLTLAEAFAPAFANQDEVDRSAAIAAMGYRLAAAGPRTRQRLLDRQWAQEQYEQEDWDGYRASDMQHGAQDQGEAAGQYALSVDLPHDQGPRLSVRTIIQRSAVIGVMAACGFGVVLFGYGREGAHVHRKAAHAGTNEAAVQVQPPEPASVAPAVVTATVQEAALTQPARAEAAQLTGPPPARVQAQAQTLAMEPAPPAPVQATPEAAGNDAAPDMQDAKPVLSRPAPRRMGLPAAPKPAARQAVLAEAALPAHPHVHTPAPKLMPVAFRPTDVKPHLTRPVVSARIELPHWLTEERPERQHAALVMSEPPHDLVAPAAPRRQAEAQPKAVAPPAPNPPPREPDTITASSDDAAPRPYRQPALRPGYGAPYPGYGTYYSPYGGYYGAAMAYAAPYPPPPGYGYAYR
jgi:hypothetical protein